MSITFDDQQPLPGEKYREASKSMALDALFIKWGIAKNRRQATIYTLITSACVIFICIFITYSALKPEPVDPARYYNPITGEPVYANE